VGGFLSRLRLWYSFHETTNKQGLGFEPAGNSVAAAGQQSYRLVSYRQLSIAFDIDEAFLSLVSQCHGSLVLEPTSTSGGNQSGNRNGNVRNLNDNTMYWPYIAWASVLETDIKQTSKSVQEPCLQADPIDTIYFLDHTKFSPFTLLYNFFSSLASMFAQKPKIFGSSQSTGPAALWLKILILSLR
jgi:hypothetical protein